MKIGVSALMSDAIFVPDAIVPAGNLAAIADA